MSGEERKIMEMKRNLLFLFFCRIMTAYQHIQNKFKQSNPS